MTQAQTPNGKLLAKIDEAVAYTGWNRIRLQEMVKAGTFTNFGSSTRFKIAWAELERYVSTQK